MAIPSIAMIPSGYKASKLYSVLPTDGGGDLDVVRATTATRVNSEGLIENVLSNVPRLDYSYGGCPSLLEESQRTNLLLRSEEFDNAYWTKSGITISANSTNSPNNSLTADSLVESAINESHSVDSASVSVTSGLTYKFSVFAKNNGRFLRLILPSGTFGTSVSANFDLSLGVAYNTSGTGATIEEYGNGWYRCSVTVTSSVTGSGILIISMAQNSSGNGIYSGDGTSGIYIWGAQLEVGSNASSYIPTVASTVTRNADVISKTGISDLIGQTEGTLYMDFNHIYNSTGVGNAFAISNGTGNNRIWLTNLNNTLILQINNEGVFQGAISSSTITVGSRYKLAIAYKLNDIAFYLNGVLVGTDNSATIPICSKFSLDTAAGSSPFNNSINSIQLFKERISNAELATLTTL